MLCNSRLQANPNLCNNEDGGALHHACQSGRTYVLMMLLDAGGDLHHRNASGDTPLDIAARLDRREVVSFLIDHDNTVVNSTKSMREAVMSGKKEVLKVRDAPFFCSVLLSSVFARPRLCCGVAGTLRDVGACARGMSFRILCKSALRGEPGFRGAHIQGSSCPPPLSRFALLCLAQVLLDSGMDPGSQDPESGDSPLHISVRFFRLELSKMLLGYGILWA